MHAFVVCFSLQRKLLVPRVASTFPSLWWVRTAQSQSTLVRADLISMWKACVSDSNSKTLSSSTTAFRFDCEDLVIEFMLLRGILVDLLLVLGHRCEKDYYEAIPQLPDRAGADQPGQPSFCGGPQSVGEAAREAGRSQALRPSAFLLQGRSQRVVHASRLRHRLARFHVCT